MKQTTCPICGSIAYAGLAYARTTAGPPAHYLATCTNAPRHTYSWIIEESEYATLPEAVDPAAAQIVAAPAVTSRVDPDAGGLIIPGRRPS